MAKITLKGNMAKVIVYTTEFCPYCRSAKTLLKGKGIPFEEVSLENKPDELAKLKARTGWRTVPQIFIGEELIGGFTELQALERAGKLEERAKG